jgi:hypothetical protein
MTRVWLFAFLSACLSSSLQGCSSSTSSSEGSRRPAAANPAKGKPDQAASEMPPEPALPRTIPPDPRYFAPAPAPDPLSCREDKDCISDTIVDTQNGCCIQETEPMPQTWSWHAWVAEHRMTGDCHKIHCKPVAVPIKLPKACLLEAHCASGRCDNTCSSAEARDAGVK